MHKPLSTIEKLDQRFPGLASRVRVWFDQGAPVLKVCELLSEQYNVSVPRATVGNYRARRWLREREARIRAIARRRAALEVLRELEMKDSPEVSTAPLQAKVRSLFFGDIDGCMQHALAKSVRIRGGRRFQDKKHS
jgi:hypothetical protein